MPATTGQIGTRTVLFTDLVGSTELRVRLGEQGADDLRRVHDQVLTEAIQEHGGVVVKGLGDGLMAVFESAADAVEGAVAVQQAAELQCRGDADRAFGVRVGVSIGDVSSEGGDYFGVPVVEAARLCGISRDGEILVADTVRALARGRSGATFEPMGELALKGLPEPLASCRVMWEPLLVEADNALGGRPPVPGALLGAATSYVGREKLRDRLDEARAASLRGEAQTLLLAGEPGVGKTRTAAELARAAFADGATVLYGRCDEDLAVPYQPFVEALDHAFQGTDTPELGRLPGELVRLLPALAELVPDLPPTVASDPASQEHRLFEAVASWLCASAVASSAGLVLVLDDVHWATKPTLQLLQHVARSAEQGHAPLCIVATYRDTDIDRAHPLSDALAHLRRLAGADRIAVENLNPDEVIRFIENAAGHALDIESRRLADAVYDETEGNPFFVGEVMRHLIETGGVQRIEDRWVVVDIDHVAIPEGIRDVVGRRLTRLSEAANELLSIAAVIGRHFEVDVLLAIASQAEDAVLDALDQAVRARLVEETSVDHYRFAHALVRTTLYEELSATRQRRVHRRVADVLEELRPNDVTSLAHHCTQGGPEGGDVSRALRYTLAAADASLAARAFAEAEVQFRGAMDLLHDVEGVTPELVRAMCGLGEAQRDQGNPEFRQTLLDAGGIALELDDTPGLVRATLANSRGYGSVIGAMDNECIERLEQALDKLGPTPTPDRARLLGQLASELTASKDHERRLSMCREAEAMARTLGDPQLLGHVLHITTYADVSSRRWPMTAQRTAEGIALADAGGDPASRTLLRVWNGAALLATGRLADAQRVTNEALAIASAEGSPITRWTVRFNTIRHTILCGDLDAADAEANELLRIGTELGQGDGTTFWQSTIAGTLWLRGDEGVIADAAVVIADLYPLARAWRSSAAWMMAAAGRFDESRQQLDLLATSAEDLLDEGFAFSPLSHLALTAWMMKDASLAGEVAASLEPYRTCWSHYNLASNGPVAWHLGLAFSVCGEHDRAVDDLEFALDEVTTKGATAYVPHVRQHLAEVLRRRGGPGDEDRASSLLLEAREEADACGLPTVVARIDDLIAARPVPA